MPFRTTISLQELQQASCEAVPVTRQNGSMSFPMGSQTVQGYRDKQDGLRFQAWLQAVH